VSRLFSAFVIVDWSAAAKPSTGADSVWIGVLKRDARFRMKFESHNPATRSAAEALLTIILDDFKKRSERVLLGFDFCLGFPRGFAKALNLAGDPPWQAVWTQVDKMVKDKTDNTNNRFGAASEINRRLTGGPFPFWGCPPKDALTTLQPRRTRAHGPDDLPEFRLTEERTPGAASIWKLYYNGSVGGQTLLGIPAVRRLKQARGEGVKVWPFETGLKALTAADLDGAEVVVAEVWPSALKTLPAAGEVKDLAQVRAMAEHYARLDEGGKLGALFAAPKDLSAEGHEIAVREEGWILPAT